MIGPFEHKMVISIGKKYETEGHSPFLVFSEGLEQYVLKTQNNKKDRDSLLKEFLCYQLLKCWSLNTPDVVSMSLSPLLYGSQIVLDNPGFSYSDSYFGSKLLANAIELQYLISASGKVPFRKILNANSLLEISLFDIWVENDDRKPTNNNLILHPHNKGLLITPIYHAFTFASVSLAELDAAHVSFSDNDSILYCPLGLEVIRHSKNKKDWLVYAQKRFYLCISKAEESFQQICNFMPADFRLTDKEKNNIAYFLFNRNRNKIVFDQFKYIVSTVG